MMVLVGSALGWSVELRAEAETVPFVDAHVHLNDESMQLEMMRRCGAKRAVVFWGRSSDNESIRTSSLVSRRYRRNARPTERPGMCMTRRC